MNKKIKIASILAPICVFTALPLLINNKDQVYSSIKNLLVNTNNENIYLTAKVDPLYEVQTIRKVTSDKDAINILFFGDNYAKNADKNLFSDYCYTNIVIPWLSTTYPANKNEVNNQTYLTCGVKVPYQTFLNDKFNVYSIQPNFKENSSIVNSTDTFFGINTKAGSSSNIIGMTRAGTIKSNVLSYDITNNFLEDGSIVTPKSSGVLRNGGNGRALASYQYYATTENHTNTLIHEMSHTLWVLQDEFGESNNRGVNRIKITDTSEKNISWKEFLNFRGVGLVATSTPATKTNQYIPADECIMKNSHDANLDFCEVCAHEIIKRGVKATQNQYLYIADPQLTPSEDRPYYKDQYYSVKYLSTFELYDFIVDRASNKHLDFRTVVDNMTLKPVNLKLRVYISGDGGFEEFSDVYHLEPGEVKQLNLVSKQQAGELFHGKNKIIGEVIDVDTNEVLATSYDRWNKHYSSSDWATSQNFNFGKKLQTVTINFLDKTTNQPLPNIKPSTLIKRKGESLQLQKILFNGYRLDTTKSNIDNSNIIVNKDLVFNYYYDPLPFKSLKLKLVNNNNSLVQEKTVKVYEGQKFVPRSSDFFLYDLEALIGSTIENQNWVESVVSPSTVYTYEQIDDNKTELVYTVSSEIPTHFNAKDIEIVQGNNLSSLWGSDYFKFYWTGIYNNDFFMYDYNPVVIYNTVDTSTVGEYFLVFYFRNNAENVSESKASLFKVKVIVKPNPSYVPNQLEAEKIRLENYSYIWMDALEGEKASMNDFEFINQNNLLSNINNFNLNFDKYDYSVVDFAKLYPGINGEVFLGYDFKIQITDKISRASIITNYFTKYVVLKSDETITPPTAEVEMQNEINRINSLSLSLKNSTLTQEEANNINQNNILQNVNGWVQTTGFAYEIIDFSNSNNQFKFKFKVTKSNLTQNSKEFTLSYQIKSEQTEQELLQQEINRINNLTLSLANNAFSQQEIDQINASNFVNNLSNWNLVTSNSNKYNYEITNFEKSSNKFTFNIKVSLKSDSSISQISNQFNLNYQITTNVNQSLINEKNRIDQLDLSFNKQEFSQDEINGILNDPSSIAKHLNNWSSNDNQFNYQFIVNPLSENQLSLTIQINDKNNLNEYQSSKPFVLYYEQSDISNNNNSGSSNNLTTVILASTLAPAGAIAAGVAGTIIYKKKRRRY